MNSGVGVSLLPLGSNTFLEIDGEIVSMVGCFQVQAKACARSTGLLLSQSCPGKKSD